MPLTPSSYAAAVGAGVENVQFVSGAETLARKILLIGTYDPAKTAVVDEVPQQLNSPEHAGDLYGFGTMLHRLTVAAFAGSQGVECWACPQSEAVASVAAAGDIDFTGSVLTETATLHLYVAGIHVPVTLADGDVAADVVGKVVAACLAKPELPALAAANVAQVDFTAKSTGPWGNEISLSFNWGFNEVLPAGVVAVVTDMAAGAGIPDIQDALDGLGTNDDQNELFFTDCVHGYLHDTTTLDAISVYNGIGNQLTGNYSLTVARPFRFLNGDIDAGSGAKAALLAIAAGRLTDRTNGVVSVPGSPNHPAEIGAMAIGIAARINSIRAAQGYNNEILPGVIPGVSADRWSNSYDDRDVAVRAGISPTVVKGNAVYLTDVLSYYHPAAIPIASNAYRRMRDISIIQNVLDAIKVNFEQDKWNGIAVVADVAKVSNATDRQKARDIDAVMDDLVSLTKSFEGHAWIYSAAFTLDRLAAGGLITLRGGGTGFNITLPIALPGEGNIIDALVQVDTNIAVLFAA